MRILFLDFDGVLHPRSRPLAAGGKTRSAVNMEAKFCWLPLLDLDLQDHRDVGIVVHSTWRLRYRDTQLRAMLGILSARFVCGAPEGPRWRAISWVIAAQQPRAWLVLDDTPGEFPRPLPREVLICDPDLGLSETRVRVALGRWLNDTA
jgi:hypothetical protein